MRTRTDIALALLIITFATPAAASAEAATMLAAASNGPWIALAVIGMVRALLCLGNSSLVEDDDHSF